MQKGTGSGIQRNAKTKIEGEIMKLDPAAMERKDFHTVLLTAITPRPIAWISTVGEDGVFNLAPYSFFQGISAKPPIVVFSAASTRDGQKKDTLRNAEWARDFVVNTVSEKHAEAMNQTAALYPLDVDEFKEVGLTAVKGELVKSPRLAEAGVSMECKVKQTIQFGEPPEFNTMIIGEIVLMHIRDEYCVDGQLDGVKLNNLGRLWGKYYCRISDVFGMTRPDHPG
jgi:flavin reductase (DIM6/NTAB) family NADH-FMN oxidoreductase RutF